VTGRDGDAEISDFGLRISDLKAKRQKLVENCGLMEGARHTAQGARQKKLKGKVKDDLGVRINRFAIVRSQLSVVRCVKGIEHRVKGHGRSGKTSETGV
jgi:hypothetical protein